MYTVESLKELLDNTDIDLMCLHECVSKEHVEDALKNYTPTDDETAKSERDTMQLALSTRNSPRALYAMILDMEKARGTKFDLELRRMTLRHLAKAFPKRITPTVAT